MFCGLYEDELHVTLDLFWTDCTDFNHNNGPFDGDEFIWKNKGISDGNSNLWHHKYSLPCTKVLGFRACLFTSKVLLIAATKRYWCYVNTIESGKTYAIRSDVSDKYSIV